MKTSMRCLLLLSSALLLGCDDRAPPAAPPAPSADVAAPAPTVSQDDAPKSFDVAAIDAWVGRRVTALGLVGASLAIARDGKIVLAKGYGKRSISDHAPTVGAQTSFAIGSVTKQLTCAAVLMLAEEGKLSLADKVSKFYPELTRASDVSLDDLMSHLSGYSDYYPLDFVDERLTKATTTDDVIHEYASRPLDFEPRAHFSYSNTGWLIAGRVVEKVSGEALGVFFKRRIFDRLGMSRSALGGKELGDVAAGHTAFALGDPEPATPENEAWLHAAGGVYASAEDLVKWDLALAERSVFKDPASYDLMTAHRKLANGTPSTYACGLDVRSDGGETLLQHGGAVSGFLAYNAVLPRTRSAVVFLTNSDHVAVHGIYSTIVGLLQKTTTPRRTVTAAGPPPVEVARALFTQMQKGEVDRSKLDDAFSRYLTDARLKAAAPRLAALGEPTIELEGTSERGGAEASSFRLRFKSTTVRASLHRGPDGKVRQFMLYRQ